MLGTGEEEVDEVSRLLQSHGWDSEGSWFQVMDSIDSIVVDHVPVSALLEIHAIESVVVVEMQNVMYPTLESANPATRIQPSDVYSGTVYDRGYDGEGVVIAVLDSGVDNEHRSLNDFDDENDELIWTLIPMTTKSGLQDMMQLAKHPTRMVHKTRRWTRSRYSRCRNCSWNRGF